MAKRINIVPDEMRNICERFNYHPAVRVGDMVYIAGQLGRDADLNVIEDKEAQFAQAFENLGIVLRAAGCGFEDVVDMTTYHTDMGDLQLFMKVKDSWKSVLDTDNDIENVTINVRFQYQNPTEQTNFWSEESETQYEFIK